MTDLPVEFEYVVGLARSPFARVTLLGSWDGAGLRSDGEWTAQPMESRAGGEAFAATVRLDDAGVGSAFSWGVLLETGDGRRAWGIMAEVADPGRTAQERTFTLRGAGPEPQREVYRLTRHRGQGARRQRAADGGPDRVRFSAWAPNAAALEVVFGGASGYIADDGSGIDAAAAPLPMRRDDAGVWSVVGDDFAASLGRRFMYRVTRDDGEIAFSTDMYSLEQCGAGDFDPKGQAYDGDPARLDGTPSCSVVAEADAGPGFWDDEFDAGRAVPRAVEELVIYELHVGALRFDQEAAGTFDDALALLPYLEDLGVNAVELLPMFEFNGSRSWGYGSSHFLAIETSAGGRDALRGFVKACHQRGIAVLMDVVYNHYNDDSARAAWQYDSARDSRNIYFWYEGSEERYADPRGGYANNVSSGWAPRYDAEQVRAMFVSSAAMLVDELHIDGLRVDQTTSIHAYNTLNADGSPLGRANSFGRKLLRELCQTLKTIAPDVMLIAEDHSGWEAVTQPADTGGVGFDAAWYVDFYHHLVGDKDEGPEYARLLHTAAELHDGPLALSRFAGALTAAAGRKVVYVESHDEAGGAEHSARTLVVAAGGAPLVGATRRVAEARCRFAAGMTLLSPGTPMFLMGEEVGAQNAYTYNRFYEDKEDLLGLRDGAGRGMFAFYRDLIRLRRDAPALRSRDIEVVHVHDANRVIAFRRWGGGGEYLVVGSLAERPYDAPSYRIAHPALSGSAWRERINSDGRAYGGSDVGNAGATLTAAGDAIDVVVPANGAIVLERTA